MNITRNVIQDLLPAYFSGEASADSRRLVEDYFRQDPEFERTARQSARTLDQLGHVHPLAPDEAQEKSALSRIHAALRLQRRLFGLALTLTGNAILLGLSFQFTTSGAGQITGTSIHWLQFPFQRYLVAGLAAAALVLWIAYFTRTVRTPAR